MEMVSRRRTVLPRNPEISKPAPLLKLGASKDIRLLFSCWIPAKLKIIMLLVDTGGNTVKAPGKLNLGNLRLAGVVAVFPVVRHAGVAEDELDQVGEVGFAPNVVRENYDAALARLHADQGVGGLAVVAAFVEAVSLRAIEDHDTQARVQVFALIFYWKINTENRELTGGWDMQLRLGHLGARGRTQAVAVHQRGGKF